MNRGQRLVCTVTGLIFLLVYVSAITTDLPVRSEWLAVLDLVAKAGALAGGVALSILLGLSEFADRQEH